MSSRLEGVFRDVDVVEDLTHRRVSAVVPCGQHSLDRLVGALQGNYGLGLQPECRESEGHRARDWPAPADGGRGRGASMPARCSCRLIATRCPEGLLWTPGTSTMSADVVSALGLSQLGVLRRSRAGRTPPLASAWRSQPCRHTSSSQGQRRAPTSSRTLADATTTSSRRTSGPVERSAIRDPREGYAASRSAAILRLGPRGSCYQGRLKGRQTCAKHWVS